VAWTNDVTALLQAVLPFYLTAIGIPFALRVLRAFERYLELMEQLERPRRNGLNGSDE